MAPFYVRSQINAMDARRFLILIGTVLVSGCVAPRSQFSTMEESQRELARVKVQDGVSSYEARVIANAYFRCHISNEGYVDPAESHGGFWTVGFYSGYFPHRSKQPIRVDKRSGRVTCDGFPNVDDPCKSL